MSGLGLLAATLGATALGVLALWGLSLLRRDASIVDIYWGAGFGVIALLAWSLAGEQGGTRATLATALALLWSVRLGGYLAWRRRGEEAEDFRYREMRAYHGEAFGRVSLYTVFLLQGALQWLVSLPLQVVQLDPTPAPLGLVDALGCALFATGFAFEAIGDAQLARFRADPGNRGRTLDTGLWRYTRHPNYFGDVLVWWGFFCFALAAPFGALSALSPVLLTFLVLRVSGVPLLERGLHKRREGYAEYCRRTSAFIPRRPRDA